MGIVLGFVIMFLGLLCGWMVDNYFSKKEVVLKREGHSVAAGFASTGGVISILLCLGGIGVGCIYTVVQIVIFLNGIA